MLTKPNYEIRWDADDDTAISAIRGCSALRFWLRYGYAHYG